MIKSDTNYGIHPSSATPSNWSVYDVELAVGDAKKLDLLNEEIPVRFKHGTIVQLSPSQEFKEFVKQALITFSIPGVMDIDKLHQTIYYAKEQFDPKIFDILKQYKGNNFSMSCLSLTNFKGHDGKTILAIDYSCPMLEMVFDNIRQNTCLRHTFPSLKLHITLDYNFNESNFFSSNFIEFSRHLNTGASWKRDKFYLTELEATPIIKNFDSKSGSNF